MKIENIDTMGRGFPSEKVRGTTTKGEKRFSEMLQEAVAGRGPAADVEPAKEPTISLPVSKISAPPISTLTGEAPLVDRIDRLLDVMEAYRRKLGDPGSSLKDIHPLVDKMTVAEEQLTAEMAALPLDDPLRETLDETLVAAHLEVVKFYRGDYVD